jgi:pyridoxal phosphate enzyme (YggS family)
MEPNSTEKPGIQQNYYRVLERIRITAEAAGRNPDAIRLVVVTKTQPIELVQLMIDSGAKEFGENYVEEAVTKINAFSEDHVLQWHMIGHLQSRKAQIACEKFQFLHSLDSVKLANILSRYAHSMNKTLAVWMEFNVGGEESKYGWDIVHEENWDKILPDIEMILQLPNLNILGLMTIPPFDNEPESSRPYFRQLRKFQDYLIRNIGLANFEELSMGMSADFEVAIQEGSTCIRIGQAIFGPRHR